MTRVCLRFVLKAQRYMTYSELSCCPLVRLYLICPFTFISTYNNLYIDGEGDTREQNIIPKCYVIPFSEHETMLFITYIYAMNSFFCYLLMVGRGPCSLDIRFHAAQIVTALCRVHFLFCRHDRT